MKKWFILFGKLYMLFFAIPFPIIMYYGINSEYDISNLKDRNPWLALGVLLASIILWLIVLLTYLHNWIFRTFIIKQNIERLKKEGIRREAKILSAVAVPAPSAKYSTYELSLSFKNLVGTDIIQKTGVNDSKPHEHRFEAGKSVDLLIDKDVQGTPYFILASLQTALHKIYMALVLIGWFAIVALVTGYYVYAYQSESFGTGWQFIGFGHPLIVCPFVLLFYIVFLKYVIGRVGQSSNHDALIKFKGISTTAKVLNVSQTGVFINQQPQVSFELEYTDHQYHTHRKSLKKVVNLLDLDMIKKENIDIFYLKENPKQIAFTTDLNKIS
jgi:hypothetical protein